MMIPALLAETDIGTYIVTAIFILAWVAGAVSQMINKYREWKARQPQQGRRVEHATHMTPPVPLEVAAERARLEHQRRKQAAQQAKQQGTGRRTARKVTQQPQRSQAPGRGAPRPRRSVPVAIVPAPLALPVRDTPNIPVTATEIRGTPTAAPHATSAAPSIASLLRPETLRHQFILTEILQKPVGLRDQHLH